MMQESKTHLSILVISCIVTVLGSPIGDLLILTSGDELPVCAIASSESATLSTSVEDSSSGF